MIETKGLQQGNYIQCLFVIGKVVEIYTEKILCQLSSGKLDVYEAKHLNYIPLTPEWLERCGFIKGGDYGFGIGYFWDHPEDIYLTELIDNGAFRLYGSEWTIGKDFKCLHQLQNLYFALTGEELTIKETV